MDTERKTSSLVWEEIHENIQVIRRFPQPHDDLFKLAERVPYWWQLANSAPVLAFMVARCWYFDKLPRTESAERVEEYVLMKRTAICAALGFPSNHRTLRLLSKLAINAEEPMPFMITDLMILKLLLRHEPSALKILEDANPIGTNEICILATGLSFAEKPRRDYEIGRGSFFITLPQCEWFFRLPASKRHWLSHRFIRAEVTAAFVDVVKLLLGDVLPLTHFRNERKAVAYLEGYLRHVKTIRSTRLNVDCNLLGWPEPPIVPPEGITPLLSYEELREEGNKMHHCVEMHWDNILLGKYYAYRMEGYCRCTIGIRFRSGSWQIDQVKGINNAAITNSDIIKSVENWISSSPASKVQCAPRLDYLTEIARTCGIPLKKSYMDLEM